MAATLADTPLWLNSPLWLHSISSFSNVSDCEIPMPNHCQSEMKKEKAVPSLITLENTTSRLGPLFNPERCSFSYRLFKITALMMKYIRCLCSRVCDWMSLTTHKDVLSSQCDLDQARLYWIRVSQVYLQENKNFPLWKHQLDLFMDKSGIWRCGGRILNSCIHPSAQNPILLDKKHHLATLDSYEACLVQVSF